MLARMNYSFRPLSRPLCLAVAAALFSLAGIQPGATQQELKYVPDTRSDRPKVLMMDRIRPLRLKDTAKTWGERGLSGFIIFDTVMYSWATDIWAQDGNHTTIGQADQTFQEVKACNEECKKYGIDSNFIWIALHNFPVSDWFDDYAWPKIVDNFRQTALFAEGTGCKGVAFDSEYSWLQFDPGWEGYNKLSTHQKVRLGEKVRQRGREITEAMLEVFPEMELLVMPDFNFYGPLWQKMVVGMIEAMADADAPGGLQMCSERSYMNTDAEFLAAYPGIINSYILERLPRQARKYWQERCGTALGAIPHGKDNMADPTWAPVASYSPQEFRKQMAAARMSSRRYVWIYAHHASWRQMSEEDVQKYNETTIAALPVIENIEEYWQSVTHPELIDDPVLASLAAKGSAGQPLSADEISDSLSAEAAAELLRWLPGHSPGG